MWLVLSTGPIHFGVKETEVALFYEEADAMEYIEYLATLGEVARMEKVEQFMFFDGE